MEMIEIDSKKFPEAGGQILRVALALSAILKKPFHITDIRADRPKPGLHPQHLMGVKATAKITDATVEGAEINSTELTFQPKTIITGEHTFDIGTAGSITLLAQSLLPILATAEGKSHLVLRGGTAVIWSPTIEYYIHVLLPIIKQLGVKAEINVKKYGFYPRGGGEVEMKITGTHLNSINLIERGDFIGITGLCVASNLGDDILKREEQGVKEIFPDAKIQTNKLPSPGKGTAVTLWAEYENTVLGAASIGKLGKRAEDVGREAANRLKKQIDAAAPLDEWMTDQILIYLALAKGKSTIRVPELTPHAHTCTWLIPKFTGKEFKIEDKIISVEGIGV